MDGAEYQMDLIKRETKTRGIEVTIVLDLVHVLEYAWKSAHCFFEVGSKAAQKWVSEQALEIIQGNAGKVAGGMRRKASKLGLSEKKRENVDKCADYLLKYKEHLRYDEYLADGLPIPSGVIEVACRYLVKELADIRPKTGYLQGGAHAHHLHSPRYWYIALLGTQYLEQYIWCTWTPPFQTPLLGWKLIRS